MLKKPERLRGYILCEVEELHADEPQLIVLRMAWFDAEFMLSGQHGLQKTARDLLNRAATAAMQAYFDARYGHSFNPLLRIGWPNVAEEREAEDGL